MTNTREAMTFDDWLDACPLTLFGSEFQVAKIAWKAATAQQEQVIAELVEALEVCKYDCNTGEVIGIAKEALAKVKDMK